MIYVIQKIHHFTLISRGCAWLSMKRGGCKFGGSKTGAVLCLKRGAVVSQLVLKLKESVPPPPPGESAWVICTPRGLVVMRSFTGHIQNTMEHVEVTYWR